MTREQELAWAAGFFDGEGSTVCSSSNKSRPRSMIMRLSQKEPELVFQLHRIMGVGKVYVRKDCSAWQVAGYESIKQATQLLWPCLGEIKRKQIERAFEKYVTDKTNSSSYPNAKHFELPVFRIGE